MLPFYRRAAVLSYNRGMLDRLREWENRTRRRLSRYPLVYAFVGGVGVVLFWRGVWYTSDFLTSVAVAVHAGSRVFDWTLGADGLVSLVAAVILLLSTGLFVNELLGKEIIESGLKKEEQLTEKTEKEVGEEETNIDRIEKEIHHLIRKVEEIDGEIHKK